MQSILINSRKADIIFRRSGRINISARVAKSLGLACGDVIDIMEDHGEYYLYIKHHAPVVGRHEGMVMRSNKSGNHFIAHSVTLSRYILSKCDLYNSARLCCGEALTLPNHGTALPIITKLLL